MYRSSRDHHVSSGERKRGYPAQTLHITQKMSQAQKSPSFPTVHRSNAKCFRTPWSSFEQQQHLLYLETSQNNGYPDCKTSASVARQRILPLFNGWKMQYAQMGAIQGMSSASSIHHASMPVASTIRTPGSLPTMLTFVPAFFN